MSVAPKTNAVASSTNGDNAKRKECGSSEVESPENNLNDLAENDLQKSDTDRRVCFFLPILVTLDMFAVSLVVPLLQSYYKNAGVTSASQREFLSSAYTSAQIIGGILIGAAGDAGVLTRKNTLLLSFLGSAFSYGVIGFAGTSLYAVVFSRIVVGLVKQTMTVGTSLLAQHTKKSERTMQMGKLTSSFTVAWMVGPSAGAVLYKNIGPSSPACLACLIFMLNVVLGYFLLPTEAEDSSSRKKNNTEFVEKATFSETQSNFQKFRSNLRACFSSKALASIIVSLLLFSWMTRATSYLSLGNFYEDMYGIETHQRGYISSYKSVLSFLVQSFLVKTLLEKAGDERRAATLAAFGLAVATLLESLASLRCYLLFVAPVISISVAILSLTLRSLLTQVAPKDAIGSALAALDILQNIVAVSVPFYRTGLFLLLEWLTKCITSDDECMMSGDPEPRAWLLSSAIHWFLFTFAVRWLLSSGLKKHVEKSKLE
mmetsp:Transcript_5856/g.7833  ORF Transcript_5856/g.7833 Transcript_5856/m.7833 type:complete len:487 (-) Transcript_5856:1106-2566(-)